MPSRTRRSDTVLTVDLAADSTDALDLLRRVRLFAEEMASAGFRVEVMGSLKIVVRPAEPGTVEVVADA